MKIKNSSELPKRADVLLAENSPSYSRSALAKLFDMNLVRARNIAIKPGEKILTGDFIEVDLSPIKAPARDIDLPIIYEDENIVVINKPIGVISHARGRYWDEASVASFIRKKVTDLTGERAGIVHRLDRATSGVMVCAKNSTALKYLQKQFSNRKVIKNYLAVIQGTPANQAAIIDVPIGRNPKNPKLFQPDTNGKSAITEYYILKKNSNYSLLELSPRTGRTHQIRVHLKYIKHPIVGDELYGGIQAKRLYLHAHKLEITLPGGEKKLFKAPMPIEFEELIK